MKYVIIALGIIFVLLMVFVMFAICKSAGLTDKAEQELRYKEDFERRSNYDNYSQKEAR
nr:hypothetical protein [uncultured Ruminococcus sp.]